MGKHWYLECQRCHSRVFSVHFRQCKGEPEKRGFKRIPLDLPQKRCIGELNPLTPKSDQLQISPAASLEILHHPLWRTWPFTQWHTQMTDALHYQYFSPLRVYTFHHGDRGINFLSVVWSPVRVLCGITHCLTGFIWFITWTKSQKAQQAFFYYNLEDYSRFLQNTCMWIFCRIFSP